MQESGYARLGPNLVMFSFMFISKIPCFGTLPVGYIYFCTNEVIGTIVTVVYKQGHLVLGF